MIGMFDFSPSLMTCERLKVDAKAVTLRLIWESRTEGAIGIQNWDSENISTGCSMYIYTAIGKDSTPP